jgi:DNA-binding NtrC family response regulator
VRELENVVERMIVLARSNEITVQDLPEFLRHQPTGMEALEIDLLPQGISLEAIEKELILKALEKCGWNQTQAAHYLDLSRKTLIYRMERHGIRRPQTRQVS